MFGEREEYVAGMARMGTARHTLPMVLVKQPAKFFNALVYCEALLKEERDNER